MILKLSPHKFSNLFLEFADLIPSLEMRDAGVFLQWKQSKLTSTVHRTGCPPVHKHAITETTGNKAYKTFLPIQVIEKCLLLYDDVVINFNFYQDILLTCGSSYKKVLDTSFHRPHKVEESLKQYSHSFNCRLGLFQQLADHATQEIILTQNGVYIPANQTNCFKYYPLYLGYKPFTLVIDSSDLKHTLPFLINNKYINFQWSQGSSLLLSGLNCKTTAFLHPLKPKTTTFDESFQSHRSDLIPCLLTV